jgi:hypothetical protein
MMARAPRIAAAVLLAVFLSACAPVASIGKRVGPAGDVHVQKLQVYSFVPMHAMGSERLHRDARGFDAALAGRLRGAKIDTVVADVEELVRRHGLAVDVRASDHDGLRRSMLLPVRDLLAVNRAEEATAGATHRLVLLPSHVRIDRPTGLTYGIVRWRLETTGDASPVAIGVLRYSADTRGFPGKRMAKELVAKMNSLGIR